MRKQWKQRKTLFSWAPKSLQMITATMKLRYLLLGRNDMTKVDSILKSRDITLLTKMSIVKAMIFPVVMYECERWTIKKAEHQSIDAFELWCWKTLESPLDCKEIKPVSPKWNQPWIFIWRTDAESEAPLLWPPDMKSWLILKDPDGEKNRRQEEKGMTEDEMVGWHQCLNGHEFEQTLGVGGGQGSLECCSPWGCKESDITEWPNSNNQARDLCGYLHVRSLSRVCLHDPVDCSPPGSSVHGTL